MTPQQIIGMAARLFAIWLAITSVQALGLAAAMSAQRGAESTATPYILAVILLVVALLLWLFPMVVAHRLLPRTRFDDRLRIPAYEVLAVACVVLGLWVIVARGVPAIAYYIAVAAFWLRNGQPIANMGQSQHINLLVGIIQLVIGCVLVFRARALSAYILPQAFGDQPGERAL